MNSDVPQALLQIAGIGMGTNILFTILLKMNVAPDSDIFEKLFAKPLLGSAMGVPYLNAKYFVPWTKSPEYLNEEGGRIRALFWIARLGGIIMALGLFGFLVSVVYIGTIGQS